MKIHRHPARYKVVVCGRRFGKSVAGINELIRGALEKPGKYWFISPFRSQSKENIWDAILLPYVPKETVAKLSISELKVTFKNGSEIRLCGANNPDALRGSGLCGVIMDEFADMDPGVWELIIEPQLLENKGWAWFIGTPKGYNHFYEMLIKDPEFHDPMYRTADGKVTITNKKYKGFKFISSDNITFDGLADEIEQKRLELAPEVFRQEYEASFENFTGRIYKEFQYAKHTGITPLLKENWNYYVGIDTGNTSAVIFVAMAPGGKVFVFDEIYDLGSTVSVIANQIHEKLKTYKIEHKTQFIIDSASQVKREYITNGIYVIDSMKDVLNSISKIRSLFKRDLLHFDIDKCTQSIAEHHSYEWDSKREGYTGKPRPIKYRDHSVNALQYILNSPFVSTPREVFTSGLTDTQFFLKSKFETEDDGDFYRLKRNNWDPTIEDDTTPVTARNTVTGY